MTEFIGLSANWPFSAALLLMLLLALLEVVGLIMGTGFSDLMDSFLPDMDADLDVDVDADTASGPSSMLGGLFGWLRLGEVPAAVSLVVFLASFSGLGLGLQATLISINEDPMSAMAASLIVLPACLPVMRILTGWLARILPQDETESVSSESFIGKSAIIIMGQATSGSAAQAKLADEYGRDHYIMVEPAEEEHAIPQGTDVIVLEQKNSIYIVCRK